MYQPVILQAKPKGFAQKALCIPILLIILLLHPQSDYGQDPPEITILESGKRFEREISGTQKHVYRITLSAGQYAAVEVEQRGIDVVVRLLGADGKLVSSFDYEIWTRGTEKIEVAAKDAGEYRLEVSASYRVLPAGRYEIRLSELREANENDKLLQEARAAYSESVNLRRAGKFRESFTQLQSALEIREKVLGPEHLGVAVLLDSSAFFYNMMGDNAKAEAVLQRSLAVKEKKLPPEHPDIAQTLNGLGIVLTDNGDYAGAIAFHQRGLTIREKSLGENHPAVANSLNNLANIFIDQAEYVKAEAAFQRALQIKEKIFGANSLDVATALYSLALLHGARGDSDKAEEFHKRALELREKLLEPDHPEIAASLNSMAIIYRNKNDFARAESLFQRSLAIREKTSGPNAPDVALTLYNLATLYHQTDAFDKAEQMYKKSLAILEARLGTEHIDLSYPLKSLAGLYRNKGEYDKSEELLSRLLSIREKVAGARHPNFADDLESLSMLYAAKGMVDKSVAAQSRAGAITERAIALNLAAGSEKQKLAYLTKVTQSTNWIISLQTYFPDNAIARELAVTTIFQRKGRVQDAMVDSLGKIREHLEPPEKLLLNKLNGINSQLAKLVLNGPEATSPAEHQAQIKKLEEEKEKLEAEISRRSAEYSALSQPVTLAGIQNLIPNKTALIEFAVYRPFDPKARSKQKESGEAHYVAYVIHKQGEVKWQELGAAKPIDEVVKNFRQALRDPKSKDVEEQSRAVYGKLLSPIRDLLGDATQLLISPDGELNLIPFEALANEKKRYLINDYAVTYLTGGRDLLRLQTARASQSVPLLIANPFFGEPDAAPTAQVKTNKQNNRRQSITATRNLSDTYFAPLGGTTLEARSIQSLFPEASFLTGAQATEFALKQTTAPKILHIATHGFFLEDKDISGEKNQIENPLLRSGLALADANRRNGIKDDGILTALEASGLNLWGTKLVVLSACDTGLGEVRNGEGVYGLRRAFVLAGTESLVMSLWSVSDFVTRELMTNYYKNLKNGMSRNAALRQVQLEMLKAPNRRHPFYWASFIQSGEWADLEGNR
jgi:CHAT domain-containing protein